MEKYESALKNFLSSWSEHDKITGVLVCGSFVTGGHSVHSDVDVQIILDNKVDWRERGNKIVDGLLIEYFANPAYRCEGYFKDDYSRNRTVTAHMFSTGKIVFDKTGDLKKLVKLSKKYLKKKFSSQNKTLVELNKYHLWDDLDNLEELLDKKTDDFYFAYFCGLKDIYEMYSKYCKMPVAQNHKVRRFLENSFDQKKYLVSDFKDKIFVKLFIESSKLKTPKGMFKSYRELCLHVLKKMGGFKIDGWKVKSSAK